MPVHCDFDITQRSLNFPRPFADLPRLIHGLREIDVKNDANIRVSSTLHNVTTHSADCDILTWGDTTLFFFFFLKSVYIPGFQARGPDRSD